MSIPLITFDGKHFKVTQEAKEFFEEIKDIKQLGVLSIIGKSKTGKSFFLNNVLLKEDVFEISHTTNPCTKGIWISKKLIDMGGGGKIMVVDVEGLGGTEDNSLNDNRIILLPLILSSYLIYNSQGMITEEAIRGLGVIVGFAKELQKEGEFSFPFFHWIIRDFTLQLLDSSGLPLTEKEYLEKSLEEQKGLTQAIESKNKIRRKFKQVFDQRDCSTLIRPYNQTIDQLRTDFLTQSSNVRFKILKSIQPKKIKQTQLDPLLFLQFVQNILIDINNGISPNVQTTYKMVYLQHQKDLLSRIQYTLFDTIQSLKDQQLSTSHITIQLLFSQIFEKQSFSPSDPSIQVIQQKERILTNAKLQIDQRIKIYKQKKLQKQSQSFIQSISQNLPIINSVYQVQKQLSKIFDLHQITLSQFDPKRTKYIQTSIKLAIISHLSQTLETQNNSLKQHNSLLLTKTQQQSSNNHKLQQQLYQFSQSISSLKQQLTHTIKQKQIIIRNLQTDLHSRKIKSQKQSQQLIKLNHKLYLIQNSEEYTKTLQRLQELQKSLEDIQKQYNLLSDQQIKMKGQNFILQQQKYQLQKVIELLKQQGFKRQQQIVLIQQQIVEQVQKQQKRIEAFIQDSQSKQKQKDNRIQKLQRIIRELKGKPQKMEQQKNRMNNLQSELVRQKSRNNKLQQQLDDIKQIYEQKLSNIMISKKTTQNSKCYKSPTKNWKKQKVCLETQISLQQELNKESKTLISSLLTKQKEYIEEINYLKQKVSESYLQSQFSSIKSGGKNNSMNVGEVSNISVSVPSFTIKNLENGHSITEFKLQFTKGVDTQWNRIIRYKQFVELVQGLSQKYPELPYFKLPKTNKADDKRTIIQKVLKQCLLIHQIRADQQFKLFIFGSKQKLLECKSQQNISRIHSPKLTKLKSKDKYITLKPSNKNPHFSIYIDP